MSLCNICLRTNLTVNTADNSLIRFYDNLLDHQMFPNLSVCATCKQFLEKCYDFKQLCQKSNKVLQDWKKKKKPEISTESLHSSIQPYYEKVFETTEDVKIINKFEDIKVIAVENKDDIILISNDNVIEIDGDDDDEKLEDNKDLLQHNDILKKSIEQSQLKLTIEPCEETDLNLSDNEDNGVTDNNTIDDNSDIKINQIGDNSDNDEYDSNDDFELINKLLEDAKKKTIEIKKKNRELQKYIKVRKGKEVANKTLLETENYKSVFDIVLFKTEAEARASFMERPNSDYYKNATDRCTICYNVFRHPKLLDYHMKWHNPASGDHVCDICELRFKTRRNMLNHRNKAHYGRYSCKKCPLVTNYTSVMRSHSKLHQGVTFKCKYCDATSRHRQNHLAHLRNFHPTIFNRTNNMCTLCGRTFASPSGLKLHKSKKHQQSTEDVETEDSVKCDKCDLTFINEDVYTVHVKETHKDIANTDRTTCALCGKRFDDTLLLRKHRLQEHPLQASKFPKKTGFTCKICGATGEDRKWLYNHYRKQHPNLPYQATVQKEYLCEHCGKGFPRKSLLIEHMRSHTGERPFACGECERTFSTRKKLKHHSQIHKPPARICTVCNKKFVSHSNLFNHMKTHTGIRRYKCSLCDKAFTLTSYLNEHVRGVHQNVKRVRKPRQQEKQTED